ncbi:Aste57867_10747 [Aphanomyces stellatus]|uniref:Aste57867_10747 protein n=1 Tax=Aphanomyces stellatus TaxID=120398 RepID=A0A485KR73_9STRA|nr:hypothetical protein As57867_010707 [Aphanomyces stellatus]VFT87617.1 Aste57867_10747 [Aphanomyces stellatus]
MCRLRQGIRQDVKMSDVMHMTSRQTEKPSASRPTATAPPLPPDPHHDVPSEKRPNIFKHALHYQMPSRPHKGRRPLPSKADDAAVAEQLHHLKQYYEERVVVLTKRCTEAETRLRQLEADHADANNDLQHLQVLTNSQHDQLVAANQEYTSLLAWCREREARWQQTETQAAAVAARNEALVRQIQELDDARRAFEVEWMAQREAWTRRQDETTIEMDHMLQTQTLLRNEVQLKEANAADAKAARDQADGDAQALKHMYDEMKHADLTLLHPCRSNASLLDDMDQLKHRVVAFEGQLQMEGEFKRSLVAECEALAAQIQAERHEFEGRLMQEKTDCQRQLEAFRERDLACRTFAQKCSRLANDLQVATARCARAEGAAHAASAAADVRERKESMRMLQTEVARLEGKLRDERAAGEVKDAAMTKLKKEMAELQAQLHEEDERRLDAQKEVGALQQRIATLRRDNMQLVGRLESPLPLHHANFAVL